MLGFDYAGTLRAVGRFMTSQAYRSEVAHRYVAARIGRWESRGQLDTDSTRSLHESLGREGAGSYITDFGVHVMIKPAVKVLQWWIIPALFVMGAVNEVVLAVALVGANALARCGECPRSVGPAQAANARHSSGISAPTAMGTQRIRYWTRHRIASATAKIADR